MPMALFLVTAGTWLGGCGSSSNSPSASPSSSPTPIPSPSPGSSRYAIQDLGVRPGASFSVGFNVNNTGQVVGDSDVHAIAWLNNQLTDLNATTIKALHAQGINDTNQIVGGNDLSITSVHTDNRAFVWQDGVLTTLGALPLGGSPDNDFSFAYEINNAGQVVGFSGDDSIYHGFIWQAGTMTDLGTPGTGVYSKATAINQNGQVVVEGNYDVAARTYLWSNGTYTNIGTLPGANITRGHDINDSNQIVGEADTTVSDSFTSLGYVWSAGTMTKLAPLSGDSQSVAEGINNAGQIVGWSGSSSSSTRAVLWENNTPVELQTLIPTDSGWSLKVGYKINNAGQITGYGTINGQDHAFLMLPRR